MNSYCLIVQDHLTEPDKIICFMTSAMSLTDSEARQRLAASPGFILEDAAYKDAMSAHALAAGAGLKTLVTETRHLSALPSPFCIDKIDFKSDVFLYSDRLQRGFAAYSGLTLLAAAGIETPLPPKAPAELERGLLYEIRRKALPEAAMPQTPPQPPPKEIIFYADIFGTQDNFPRLRLRHDQFDFSGLGAAKTYASAANFRLLLDELQARCFAKPLTNRSFEQIKREIPPKRFALKGLEAYEKELAGLVCATKTTRPSAPCD